MKTVIAKFTGDNYANVYDVYQWDYGQVLRIEGLKLPNMVEIHFSLEETSGEAKTRIGVTKDGVTDVVIPDGFLENEGIGDNYKIFVWVYVADKESGSTEYKITIHVKARSKPEVPGGGDNPDIFHEAVLEVRKSAEKAEEAQRQAEGWAHGREDLPERAEDNAMYYAGKASEDAKKTAQDRAEVERLTESNTQMQGEVAKDLEEVKKLSSQAQASATNAALSEQKSEEAATRAETAQAGAETAEDNAELAAQKTGQDKTAVEQAKKLVQQMGQEVLDNKNAVDKTVQDFALTAQQALADVNNAGQAQTERVQTAGTTAVENIKTAQNTATQAVEIAKSEAVKVVQTEGTTLTGAVTAEGEKQVQAVQTAAQEIITDREQIQKNKTDIADLRQNKADAIVETASGTLLNVKDSADALFEDFSVYGKTEQAQTTGKNILSIPNIDINTPETIIKCNISKDICISVQEKATVSKSVWRFMALYKNNDKQYITDASLPGVFYATSENPIVSITCRGIMITSGVYRGIMVEYGEAATSYEPYTGEKPSPSPEYPQEIVNAGKWNEAKQKYEIDIRVNTGNLFNETTSQKGYYTGDVGGKSSLTSTLGCSYETDINIGAGVEITVSIQTTVNTRSRIYAVDLNGIILYKYEDFSANASDNNHTFIVPDRTKKILVSISEISSPEDAIIMVNVGKTQLPYEPYKEQILPLTSDRPITKWDRLVEQNGQIGWLYASKKYVMTGNEIFEYRSGYDQEAYTNRFITINDLSINRLNDKQLAYCKILKRVQYIYAQNKLEEGIDTNANQLHIKLSNDRIGVLSSDDTETRTTKITEYIKNTYIDGIEIMYMSNNSVFVPLPQPEQEAIRALQTYYPTTVVSNSEDTEMQLSYVADTKNYTDRKIEEAVSAQTQNLVNLLSLMPLSTQAAMIENDTNNILDMEVQNEQYSNCEIDGEPD